MNSYPVQSESADGPGAAPIGDTVMAELYYDNVNPHLRKAIPNGLGAYLEFGCGAGGLGRAVKADNPGARYFGVELMPEMAAQAADRLDGVQCLNLDHAFPVLPHGSIDCAVFGDVLEHVRSPAEVLMQTRPLLSETGIAVASIPNVGHVSVLRSILRGDFQYQDEGLLDRTHIQLFGPANIFKIFLEAGYWIRAFRSNARKDADTKLLDGLAALSEHLGLSPATARQALTVFQYGCTAAPLRHIDTAARHHDPVTLATVVRDSAHHTNNLHASNLGPRAMTRRMLAGADLAEGTALAEVIKKAKTDWVFLVDEGVYLPAWWFAQFFGAVQAAERTSGPVYAAGVLGVQNGEALGRLLARQKGVGKPVHGAARSETLQGPVLAVKRSALNWRFSERADRATAMREAAEQSRAEGCAPLVVEAPLYHNVLMR